MIRLAAAWGSLAGFVRYVRRQFVADQCLRTAAALAYTTLLALVPLVTVVLLSLSLFPGFQVSAEALEEFLFQNFVPAVGTTVQDYLHQFADRAAGLRTVGVVFLLVTAVALLATIESAFNRIWRVREDRPAALRFLIYWAVLTLGPVLVGGGMLLTSYLLTHPLMGLDAGALRRTLLALSPFAATALGFTLVYKLVPNRFVATGEAVFGGVTAAVLFEFAKHGFAYYLVRFPTYESVYGAFSAVPIFLVWIYLCWLVVLLGAEVARCAALYRFRGRRRAAAASGGMLHDAFRIVGQLWRAQQQGDGLSDRALLRREPNIDYDRLNRVLASLHAKAWVHRTRGGRWLLSRDLHQQSLLDLYRALPGLLPAGTDWAVAEDPWDQALNERLQALAPGLTGAFDRPLSGLYGERRGQDEAGVTPGVRS